MRGRDATRTTSPRQSDQPVPKGQRRRLYSIRAENGSMTALGNRAVFIGLPRSLVNPTAKDTLPLARRLVYCSKLDILAERDSQVLTARPVVGFGPQAVFNCSSGGRERDARAVFDWPMSFCLSVSTTKQLLPCQQKSIVRTCLQDVGVGEN